MSGSSIFCHSRGTNIIFPHHIRNTPWQRKGLPIQNCSNISRLPSSKTGIGSPAFPEKGQSADYLRPGATDWPGARGMARGGTSVPVGIVEEFTQQAMELIRTIPAGSILNAYETFRLLNSNGFYAHAPRGWESVRRWAWTWTWIDGDENESCTDTSGDRRVRWISSSCAANRREETRWSLSQL
jgi:hypothetical protein